MLSSEAVIDSQLLATVLAAGHSRVPVHEGENRQARQPRTLGLRAALQREQQLGCTPGVSLMPATTG